MLYFYIPLVLLTIFLIYMRFEASWLDVSRIYISEKEYNLKVILLSDIHIGRLKVSPDRIRKVIHDEKPDIVILTGDYIEHVKQMPSFLEFLHKINAVGNMYLCLGNHDYKTFIRSKSGLDSYINAIESAGANIMHNRCVCIEKNSRKYNLVGIADMRYNRHDIDLAFKNCCNDADLSIGFSHNPDIALKIPKGKLDYLLCGHFHGGQIWAPFDLEFKVLRNEKLCKMGIKSGLHRVGEVNLYISRGLGNVCFPLRFLSRPEITVFYLP
ncbi:MAG: metallophosphoesterase [Clostridia bacterium]|nr:metallophosphoesterase [Clostridia bacterium]